MMLVRGYLAALLALMLLVSPMAIVIQPLIPWIVACFVLAVVYGALIRT